MIVLNRKNMVSGTAKASMWLLKSSMLFRLVCFGQNTEGTLPFYNKFFMSLSKLAGMAAIFLCGAACLVFPHSGFAQTNYYASNGTEYSIVGSLPGDQMFPDIALNTSGGYLVWQDNVTDGNGWGISAARLDSTFATTLGSFRVNATGTNDQQSPHVALLKNGGAAFVWQGGAAGRTKIFTRFLVPPTNTWLTATDVVVGSFTNTFQTSPALAVLNNGNVVIVWSSYNQAGLSTKLDIYGAILSSNGQTISNAFLINQFTSYNQRNPAVAALSGGGFVVSWVSEQQNKVAPTLGTNVLQQPVYSVQLPSVDVYARLYQSNGSASGNEFLVNQVGNPSATPGVAAATNGNFLVTWSARDPKVESNGWDIYARSFSSNGLGGSIVRVNSHPYGDQYLPRISALGVDYLLLWTSLAQDGSHEGVYGQFIHDGGSLVGSEFKANSTTLGSQMQPALAADGSAWFDVVWTSFTGTTGYGFDLYSQRYANVAAILQPLNAPYVFEPYNVVSNKYIPQLQVSWPSIPGVSVASFQVFVDGATTPTNLPATTNFWTMGPANGLTISSTHSFQVGYTTTSGGVSPISPSATGTTWSGNNYYGIPFEWMEFYYGGNFSAWPTNVNTPLVRGGLSLYNVFLSGGNPLDSSTWLTVSVSRTSQGIFLNWNPQPGKIYQVQQSSNLHTWSNFGAARFAAGITDSLYVGTGLNGYFRVVLLR